MNKRDPSEEVKEVFGNLLDKIGDQVLASKVEEVWKLAISNSVWPSLIEVPFGIIAPQISLVAHVKSVTEITLAMASVRRSIYSDKFDNDILISAGLLHDVGKVVEFCPDGKGGVVTAEPPAVNRHWLIGSAWAYQLGLPAEVIDIIASHTNQNRLPLTSPESILLYMADMSDANLIRKKFGAPLLTDPLKDR